MARITVVEVGARELYQPIEQGNPQVIGAATDAIKVVFREGMTVIALLGFLFWTNWRLTMVFVAITPIIAIVVGMTGKKFRNLSTKLQTSMGEVTHITSETINGHRVVRSFGGEAYEQQRFRRFSCAR
jgi:subfamily B ATP-binding cassette protein MsbA